jgi:hypothetical protein
MTTRRIVVLAAMIVCVAAVGLAQDEELPLSNWTAPPYWRTTVITAKPGLQGQIEAGALGMTASVQSLPSSPLPFVAITPCRIVDTRVNVADGFHEPNFSDDETRTFDLPNSPDCTGLPASAGAWSLNVQFRPIAQASYITMFPTGTTRPLVSTTVGTPAGFTTDAAIVPAGTNGDIDVYCQYAGRVVIDINGYYASQSLVSSLNTKTGDLTLAAGSNVTITPSTNTLTIAATGGPGGDLPAGSLDQTLRHNGINWVSSSALTNNGTNVGIATNLLLPDTGSGGTSGVIELGGGRFIHNYAGGGNAGFNTFVGRDAGNFSMGGANIWEGSYNTAVGHQSLASNTTGYDNTASGKDSLRSNTAGYQNTATGGESLYSNTTGYFNTATGYTSLYLNTTGFQNTGTGYQSLAVNTTGTDNTATGSFSLAYNTTGGFNTATGSASLGANTDGSYNTATGRWSLTANTTGYFNTATGWESLHSNSEGTFNTATGTQSLHDNTADYNTATGGRSLYANTTGDENTGSGFESLFHNTTGAQNTALGYRAGYNLTTGDNNIDIGNQGVATEASTIRIGDPNLQTRAFVAGIRGVTTDVQDAVPVLIDSAGQLGTTSSSLRFKQDVTDMGDASSPLMKLRPVTFHYKVHPDGRLQYGLIAEEVEQMMPALVIKDAEGQPETVAYHELPAMLLNELQKQQSRIRAQQAEIEKLKSALAASRDLQAQLDELRRQVQTLIAAREGSKPVETVGN